MSIIPVISREWNMFWAGFAFLLGDLVFQQFSWLPHQGWLLALSFLIAFLYRFSPLWWMPVCFVLGFSWGLGYAHLQLTDEIPDSCLYQPVDIRGQVVGLPDVKADRVRFLLKIATEGQECLSGLSSLKVRASWYRTEVVPMSGERWVFRIKFRKIRNFYNPGGFDYEAHMLGQGIRYSASVITGHRLEGGHQQGNQTLRTRLSDQIDHYLAGQKGAGVIKALVVGDRSSIGAGQRDDLLHTGTLHLMAISGLHIGMVASLGFLLAALAWRTMPRLSLIYPSWLIGGAAAVVSATFYAYLAGFSLPTQRALIMLLVVMIGLLLRRKTDPGSVLGVALFVVLLLDPFSVNLPGFWLSFIAVGLLLFAVQTNSQEGRLSRWVRVQWVLMIGLLPMSLMFFQGTSVIAPLANLLAIPWVGLTVLPPALFGVLMELLGLPLAKHLFGFASTSIEWLLAVLHLLSKTPGGWMVFTHHGVISIILAYVSMLFLFMPRGWPVRGLGVVFLLPLLTTKSPAPAEGAFWMDVLDVGEGLAIVIRTSAHTLVYDTGPSFGTDFNTGQAVILPWLRAHGIRRVDTLVVSHGDNDHIGGASSLIKGIPVLRILSSVPGRFEPSASICRDGDAWEWDGVRFQVVHPPDPWPFDGNNASCVLVVANHSNTLLLTGDIESISEFRLRKAYPDLSADVLVVPHHGSTTSSTLAFLELLNPEYAIVSSGYRNRFGFPRPQVLDRYSDLSIPVFNTADKGAISSQFSGSGPLEMPKGYVDGHRRYWNSAP
jgi:competence protein ComEC